MQVKSVLLILNFRRFREGTESFICCCVLSKKGVNDPSTYIYEEKRYINSTLCIYNC